MLENNVLLLELKLTKRTINENKEISIKKYY